MRLSFLSILGALAFAPVKASSADLSLRPREENAKGTEVPDVVPYNFMFPSSTTGYRHYAYNVDDLESVHINFYAIHKKARVVYKDDSQKEVVGFDLYMRGSPVTMEPFEHGERLEKEATIMLDLPISPNSWSSAEITHTHAEPKYTLRERFMRNKYGDIYLRFRRPGGASPSKTKALVDELNANSKSISGIKAVKKLLVTANNAEMSTISESFEKGVASKIYLDLEYQALDIEKIDKIDTLPKCISIAAACPTIVIIILVITMASACEFKKLGICLVGLGITSILSQFMVWALALKTI